MLRKSNHKKTYTTMRFKKHIWFLTILAAICLFCSCSKFFHRQQDDVPAISPLAQKLGFSKDRPLVMGMNTSYAPLQYVDDSGLPSGYDVEFTKILMRRMGIPFTFSPNHWDKMSPGIIGGKYDMGMLVYSSYRKDLTNYSNAVFRLYYQIVYRKKDYTEFDFRHLKGKKIAYMKSRPVGLMLKDGGAIDYPITDLSDAFKHLAEGEYDGLICYRFQARYNITQQHLEKVLKADELSLEPREYCYASYKKELIDAVNAEIKRMEAEGIIDEVYGQEVVSQFDNIEIPLWVWGLLIVLTFLFLIIFSVNRYRLSQRLQVAYDQMAEKNEALRLANARAEESTRMKSAFIKQISHEIRTPLNILSGFTQLLVSPNEQLSADEKTSITQQILDSTDRITSLVNKMLELSEVSSHTVIERKDNVSSLKIAREAVMATGISDAPHLTFEILTEEGADDLLTTDLQSATRILELVLDNAMKFTHPAEAYLPQTTIETREHAVLTVGHGRFVVENTGKTIPESEAQHIFDEFVQLDEYYDGTGIGLTVARSLARRLGGDITLDTTYTQGARFIVDIETEQTNTTKQQ